MNDKLSKRMEELFDELVPSCGKAETEAGNPDEFEVMVVAVDGYVWQTYGIYQTRREAAEAVKSLDPSKYSNAGIKPQISAYRPFQTHAIQEVRVGQ